MRDAAEQITWIAVADGERGLILENEDIDRHPMLSVIRVEEIDNPPTHKQGADRPGRVHESVGARRAAYDETDWRKLAKEQFAKAFAADLNRAALADRFDRLVIFAPPATLGALRPEYHPELEKRLLKEVGSNLTNLPVEELEERVKQALSG